jgi:hypothetical protein
MVDVVKIEDVRGWYSPVGKEYLEDGDYFRLPDGRLFHFVHYSPAIIIDPVEEKDIPEGAVIVEMVDSSKDPRFKR